MGCTKDSGCLRIAKTVYPGLKNDLDNSVSLVNRELDEVVSTLSGLYVPDDYLGNKVRDRIKSICNNLTEDKGNMSVVKGNIDSFIDEKIVEHKEHYNEWQQAQERLKAVNAVAADKNILTNMVINNNGPVMLEK